MQTLEENKINYVIFPYNEFSTGSLPSEGNIFILYAYQTMKNDIGSYSYASSSVEENSRWRIATTDIITSGSATESQLKFDAGTTYEIELWYGLEPQVTWGQTTTTWAQTTKTWGIDAVLGTPHIVLGQDRIFVSGSVTPDQKIYVSSNEDAVLRIYQG